MTYKTQDWELVYNGPGRGFSLRGNGRELARNIAGEDLAHIFLAGPELLEALKDCVDYLTETSQPSYALEKARAAVAKAETFGAVAMMPATDVEKE